MNERIEQLAEQCVTRKFYVDHASEEFDYKKFAELIVQECASIDFYKLAHIGTEDDYNVTQVIKKHFGVEE